jgi:hypothetical protein
VGNEAIPRPYRFRGDMGPAPSGAVGGAAADGMTRLFGSAQLGRLAFLLSVAREIHQQGGTNVVGSLGTAEDVDVESDLGVAIVRPSLFGGVHGP